MKTDCDVITDLMPLYADRICSEKSRELVEEHCRECDICKRRLDAMNVPLPDLKKADGAKNPLKKTKRHYIKLGVFTALICLLLTVIAYKPMTLTVSEIYGSGESWTSLKTERELKKTGELIKKGECKKALSQIGITALDGSRIYLGDNENADILESYSEKLSEIVKKYPVKGISCKCAYKAGSVQGQLELFLDEKNLPTKLEICFDFIRDDDGRYYILRAILNNYADAGDPEAEEKLSEIWHTYGVQLLPDYPADFLPQKLERAVKGDGLDARSVIYTSRSKELDSEHQSICEKYIIEAYNGFEIYKTVNVDRADYKAEMEEYRIKYAEYENFFKERAMEIFTKRYKFISVYGERPRYAKERFLDGSPFSYDTPDCFRQKITINMETQEGTAFYVSFDARVGFYIDTPFKDVTFSENTPKEFIDGFNELFC